VFPRVSLTVNACPVDDARMTTPIQFPAVFVVSKANVDVFVVPASFPACCTSEMALGVELETSIGVTSLAVLFPGVVSPPPVTVTVFVTLAGAVLATFTVTVMSG
jgi:hypothetical protein